ncbi:MAG: copper oxidase, partial [Gammaproteobacteria bacterium]
MIKNRRQFLKTGAALTVPSIFGGVLLPSAVRAQLCRPTGIRSPLTEPDSPPVTAYTEPLFVPDKLQPVNPVQLTPPPDPNRHQRFDEFLPQKYYIQHITEGVWNYHSQLSALTPAQAGAQAGTGSLAWLYNSSTPGATLVARYGEPVFVRRYNDLPTSDVVEMPIGYPAISTHLHNAHTAS